MLSFAKVFVTLLVISGLLGLFSLLFDSKVGMIMSISAYTYGTLSLFGLLVVGLLSIFQRKQQ